MEYQKYENHIALRIDKGESILTAINEVCDKENVKMAFISGIGAASKMDIGNYVFNEKVYVPYHYEGDFEITSLIGNVTTNNGEFYLHLHITASDHHGKTYGGHLNDAIIGATCEIHMQVLDLSIDRQYDEEIGINIFDFK